MKEIIYITSRRLLPLNSGDKILTFNILKRLSKKFSIHIINLNEGDVYSNEEYITIDQLSTSLKVIYFKNEHSLSAKLKSIILNKMYWKVKLDISDITFKVNNTIKNHKEIEFIIWDHLRSALFFTSNEYSNILIEHNNEANIIKSKINKANNYITKYILKLQANHVFNFMNSTHTNMDRVISLNNDDFQNMLDAKKYSTMDYLLIDFEHNEYLVRKHIEPINILFVGSLDWNPNIEAIKWFINEVLPILNAKKIAFKLKIVGRNPNNTLINYLNKHEKVELHTNVPNIESYYLNSDIFIVPIFSGSGINIKVLEALSYGIPIVMSKFAKRGYSNLNFIEDSNTKNEFANSIVKLISFSRRDLMNKEALRYYKNYQNKSTDTLNNLFYN